MEVEEEIEVEQWLDLEDAKNTSSKMKSNAEDKIVNQENPNKVGKKEAEQVRPWANLFATNKLAVKGMNLSYIAPVIVEDEKIEILPEDTKKEEEKWKSAFIVYVVGTKPTISAMVRFINSQNIYEQKPEILYHSNGYYVVRFENKEDRDKILCSGLYHPIRRPIIMKPWTPKFNFKEEILNTIPLWIKLSNLPLNCWNAVVLSKIGSRLGQPLYADEYITQASRISFARILVEIDITKELPKSVKIKDVKGKYMNIWWCMNETIILPKMPLSRANLRGKDDGTNTKEV